ncbi:Shedu immune nuclease family protein [Bradyrhizobium aeschynomenes]|uniref:Shedu immune nuclease family protein n=1 Tax=Bradyrhizobium aeschynomenes TaxID=2734909 RepID=UPI001553D4D0|nr:Shedu immune nuclease family protein [Bradyrhizobium aeschynomenes]NPV22317.1 DUF4263 domain-containing protein [Bradyrhizobium aeschynomenes]
MTQRDVDYLTNYRPNNLYTQPARNRKGAYATLVGDSEVVLGEIDVTTRCKIAVSAFYVQDRLDFGTLKITKIKFHKRLGWRVETQLQVNDFQLAQIRDFLAIISSLNLQNAKKTRVLLDETIHVDALGALLSSSKGAALIKELATNPELHQDIYAVSAKRTALAEFSENLNRELSEAAWQGFFEANPWIFGHGLNYIFLNKASKKLETQTTGASFDRPGKRVDGLMQTKAEVSQYVLIEIKKNDTDLLREDKYRSGVWGISAEVSSAVTQIQKTVFDFTRNRFRDYSKDGDGNDTGRSVYSIDPRSFLIIGDLAQLASNDDKVACFELFRRNLRAPEIITFDELYQRANCIVDNISKELQSTKEAEKIRPHGIELDDDIPF